jgi:MYXO-CTERM domain-containing protein
MHHRPRSFASFVVSSIASLGVALVTAHAHAACLNKCDITATPAVVTPPLDCASIMANTENCDCGMELKLMNGCAGDIVASGFELDSCWGAADQRTPCTAQHPDEFASVRVPLSTTGHRDYSFKLLADDGPHTVTFSSDVTSFGSGCSCNMPGTSRTTAPLWLGLGIAAVAFGRRRAHSRAAAR